METFTITPPKDPPLTVGEDFLLSLQQKSIIDNISASPSAVDSRRLHSWPRDFFLSNGAKSYILPSMRVFFAHTPNSFPTIGEVFFIQMQQLLHSHNPQQLFTAGFWGNIMVNRKDVGLSN